MHNALIVWLKENLCKLFMQFQTCLTEQRMQEVYNETILAVQVTYLYPFHTS